MSRSPSSGHTGAGWLAGWQAGWLTELGLCVRVRGGARQRRQLQAKEEHRAAAAAAAEEERQLIIAQVQPQHQRVAAVTRQERQIARRMEGEERKLAIATRQLEETLRRRIAAERQIAVQARLAKREQHQRAMAAASAERQRAEDEAEEMHREAAVAAQLRDVLARVAEPAEMSAGQAHPRLPTIQTGGSSHATATIGQGYPLLSPRPPGVALPPGAGAGAGIVLAQHAAPHTIRHIGRRAAKAWLAADYSEAAQHYTRALAACDAAGLPLEERAIVYVNRAACRLQIGGKRQHQLAVRDAELGLRVAGADDKHFYETALSHIRAGDTVVQPHLKWFRELRVELSGATALLPRNHLTGSNSASLQFATTQELGRGEHRGSGSPKAAVVELPGGGAAADTETHWTDTHVASGIMPSAMRSP
jgi:hypothetical protein